MATNLRKKIFFIVFCLASITQGMYSTYFVSILTTIERVYQIQSKTAGAILSATEIGQILGSLLIAYYGGKGNKPKWIAACMTLSALAALISISPHFLLYTSSNHHNNDNDIINQLTATLAAPPPSSSSSSSSSSSTPYTTSDLTTNSFPNDQPLSSTFKAPSLDQLCFSVNLTEPLALNSTHRSAKDGLGIVAPSMSLDSDHHQSSAPFGLILTIFFTCLLAIGFGSTAITTLGIPFIDDIVSREDSPLYLGLTIGLKIFGPALGFLLGSFCINLNLDPNVFGGVFGTNHFGGHAGAWWLGLIVISVPLLILALPMYYLSRMIDNNDGSIDDYGDITYQAAEDHDIGGSHDFQSHMLGLGGMAGDLADLTSNRTCFSSEIDSSSREVLQSHSSPVHPQYHHSYHGNYGRNLAMEHPMLSDEVHKTKLVGEGMIFDHHNDGGHYGPLSSEPGKSNHDNDTNWRSNICVVVNHFGGLERANFTNEVAVDEEDENDNNNDNDNDDDEARSMNNEHRQTPCARSSSTSSSSSSRSFIVSSIVPPSYKSNNNNLKQSQQQLQQLQQQQQQQQQLIPQSTLADLSSTLSRLIKNKLLLLRMLSGILHILPIAGFYTFFPKYLIEQFRITTSSASAISGLAGILFVGIGAFLGGTIVRLFNVNSRLMTRWIATSALLYTIGMLILMNLGCSSNQTIHYESLEFMTTDCSASCKCSNTIYNPVCANGTTYISPCLAGCKSYNIIGGDKIIYDECGCSSQVVANYRSYHTNRSLFSSSSSSSVHDDGPHEDTLSKHRLAHDNHVNLNVATPGHCLIECDNLKWYIIIFSISTLIHASCEVGSMMFNLRCVNSADRTLALGLTTFTSSLLGTIPCSVIYGTIVDLTCVHWDSVKSTLAAGGEPSRGACRAYENDSFRYYLHGLTALVMFLAFIVDCFISRQASQVDFYDGNDSRTDIRMELKKSTETI